MTTVQAVVGAIAADAIALAAAFGLNVTTAQQAAILAFVGTTTGAAAGLVAWVETHKLRAKAAVAASVGTATNSTATDESAAQAAAQIVAK